MLHNFSQIKCTVEKDPKDHKLFLNHYADDSHQSDELDSFNPDEDKAIFEQLSIESTES